MSSQEHNRQVARIWENTGLKIRPGETCHVNHEGCPAGEDTRKRLYFTRETKPNNLIKWYCHNCQQGGAFKLKTMIGHSPMGVASPRKDNGAYIERLWGESLDMEVRENWSNVPEIMREWLFAGPRKWLPHAYFPKGCVRYHPMQDAFIMSMWDEVDARKNIVSCSPPGVQLRYFREYGPKCITVKAIEEPITTLVKCALTRSSNLVLVEDILSAYWLTFRSYFDRRPLDVVCLWGAHITIEQLHRYVHTLAYRNIAVWLDNDNPTVIEHAQAARARASMLGAKATLIEHREDPKNTKDPIELLEKEGFTFE